MEELDLLKKNWNNTNNFPKMTEENIYAMLHKNSSSAVKWIFIISVIEFLLGIILSFSFSLNKNSKEDIFLEKIHFPEVYLNIITGLSYIIILYFIYNFYISYKKIEVLNSTKQLMKNIFIVRKIVTRYILFNLSLFAVIHSYLFGYGVYIGITDEFKNSETQISEFTILLLSILISILLTALMIGVFLLIYNFLYGRLLRKLKRNYHELEKIS
ncbi:hypothetical protein B0A78_02365 [Flavobacterium columnare NBRC 100251 = ATCC 23463]|uniref:hypothetical protein n=1 Tax=Flavobacterium columnare TaxID=996 RepID=UPI0007F98BE2|nr:hypothetical protein [Flavobacterium columnare]ANO49120.1 hypothetical protein Pf1_00872 [Flavobacterium columnare]APT22881.1 hypothetical protein BU993_09810 [Flavobacterium columnare]PDS26370.1 hypothetical protein B0A78_02365 [Flavobacterium columnare NBRC 100251 = ATCC 23463]QOG90942.1 hypothetical protein HUE41_13510 [Flavobacterium columnare]QOG93596.1 hypothetical protein HUE42_13505 [Flavobacterium columnare]